MQDHTTHESPNEIPYGYCHCGCGQKTTIAPNSASSKGWMKGEPRKFILGHRIRLGIYASAEDAFWSHVTVGPDKDCWEWQGPVNGYGYGLVQWVGNQRERAHRVSYALHFGPFSHDLQVLHKCDNPRCVNPGHLFLGTIADNMRDKTKKGRQRKGVSVPSSKLGEDDVLAIRELAVQGMLHREISERFSINRSAVTNIVNRKRWKHIE